MSSSSRKKQDEKNVKILRDLVSLQHNKYCFDCNQRGPTYVNVTIGSFVCTKCSGILRGITPPHRVKSISMATFTPEEIELIKNRGNDYCRLTWLGLYEGKALSETRDEQFVRDFMVDKYERKRYYLDPSISLTNGVHPQTSTYPTNKTVEVKPLVHSKIPRTNGTSIERNNKNLNNTKVPDFIADFGSADIYNAINANKDNKLNNNITQSSSFANFDNNAIFNSNINSCRMNDDDWGFSNFDVSFHQALFPKCNANNHWNPFLPITDPCSPKSPKKRDWVTFENEDCSHTHSLDVAPLNNQTIPNGPPAPSEDRYAALKDLDNALKVQPQIDWNSGSNGSSYGSVTPTSSIYSSSSPHGSVYGSPTQSQFASVFPQQESAKVSNPFNNGSINWGDSGNQTTLNTQNPFRIINNKVNGTSTNFNNSPFPACNGTSWNANPAVANPFSMGAPASNGHSSNPFL